MAKAPFGFELIDGRDRTKRQEPSERNGVAAEGCRFRVYDANDDGICSCFLREHAELLADALNAFVP